MAWMCTSDEFYSSIFRLQGWKERHQSAERMLEEVDGFYNSIFYHQGREERHQSAESLDVQK